MKRVFSKITSVIMSVVLTMSLIITGISINVAEAASCEENTSSETIMQRISKRLAERTDNNVLEAAMPSRGNANLLIVNMVFDDINTSLTTTDIENMTFGEYDRYNTGVYDENLTEYFAKISYNKLNVTGKVVEYKLATGPSTMEQYDNYCKQALDDYFSKEDIMLYDANEDNYLDGVIFICPSQTMLMYGRAFVDGWNYSCGDYNVCTRVNMFAFDEWSCSTMEHEMIHLMGLPDIYANVSINPNGSQADTLMDGLSDSWNSSKGGCSNDIAGIMKFFFGWIDNLQEVSDASTYSLNSYSVASEAMVIYPKGDTESDFVFFVEYLTPEGTCEILDYAYVGAGGLRIWAVKLNVDVNGNIIGNDTSKGCGSSPYTYLEALNIEGSKYVLNEGDELSADTIPSSKYFTEYKLENEDCVPVNSLDSGITINNYDISSGKATFYITIDNPIYTYENGNESFEYVINSNGGVTITKYTGSSSDVIIPESIDNKPVTVIGENSFAGRNDVQSVHMPETITQICDNAFSGCSGIDEFVFPEKLDNMHLGAFTGCNAIDKLYIPKSVKVFIVDDTLLVDGLTVCCYKGSGAADAFTEYGYTKTFDYTLVVLEGYYGDCNNNDSIDISDAVVLKQHLAGIDNVDINITLSDVNVDCKVDITDAVKLLKYLAGYTDVKLGEAW